MESVQSDNISRIGAPQSSQDLIIENMEEKPSIKGVS